MGTNKVSETYSHPVSTDADIVNAEKFIESAFRNISGYFPGASGESDFHRKYAAYKRGCELDFNVALKRKYASYSAYTIDLRSKLINQAIDDRSNLGLVSLSYVSIPNDFKASSHRYPDSSHYRKTTDFQKRLASFMERIVGKNRNCLKVPTPATP